MAVPGDVISTLVRVYSVYGVADRVPLNLYTADLCSDLRPGCLTTIGCVGYAHIWMRKNYCNVYSQQAIIY